MSCDPVHLLFFSGLFQLNNVTGELWCMKALDREAVASYELTIGCRELTTETRRQEKRETTGQYMVTSSRGTVAQWTESLTLTWVQITMQPFQRVGNFGQPTLPQFTKVYD